MIGPAVSVIVPNYNHARFLGERIDSILGQTFQDFEVILLDDCSTDDSVSVLKAYSQHPQVRHVIVNERNTGSACKQWDRGIRLAAGEFIWIAESDDLAEPRLLEVLVGLLRRNPEAVLAYTKSTFIDEHGMPLPDPGVGAMNVDGASCKDFTISAQDMLMRHLRHFNAIPNASAVIFRRCAALATEMPAGYRFCGDWLFWARLLARGDVAYTAEPLNYFRCHTNTTRAAGSIQATRQRAAEALRVIHEIHHCMLQNEVSASLSSLWINHEWQRPDAKLPWFIFSEPGISLRLRIDFFRRILIWRAWWNLERGTRWLPGRKALYRRLLSRSKAPPSGAAPVHQQ